MKTKREHRRSASGLTWVLLGVGVVGALAYATMPKSSCGDCGNVDIARASVEKNGALTKALEAFQSNLGRFPYTDEGLQILFQKKGVMKGDRFNGPYMDGTYERNCKDPWGKLYEYKSPGEFNEDSYDLWSCGEDGVNDNGKEGSDDIKNWSEK